MRVVQLAKRAESQPEITTNEQPLPLKDKVALIFDGANEDVRSLALSLAKYGADIAIGYRKRSARHAQETEKLVRAEGRRCLIMPAGEVDSQDLAKEAIRLTIGKLGRLDIFIDYSSSAGDASLGGAEENDDINDFGPLNKIEAITTIPDQIVQTEITQDQGYTTDTDIERSNEMRVAQELMNKPIFSVNEGREIGKVQDFYVDQDLTRLVAIHLGSEGLLSRKETLIKMPDVVTLGQDAILVKDANCVMEADELEDSEDVVRRDEFNGRPVDTPGGTKIGRIGDIVLDDRAKIAGFALSQIYVSGPIASNRAISREAVIDMGDEDGVMTADLPKAEKADLQVVYEGFFSEPSVAPAESEQTAAEA